jgi:dihydropteroate synthase
MVAKDTFFYIKTTVNCRGTLLDLSTPEVMGILNLSVDSFYDGGKFSTEKEILLRVENLLQSGCMFIDIGASSSRPGASVITQVEESKRLIPALKSIVKEFPKALLSIDTCRAAIARKCIDAGAALINDISGGRYDENMFKTIGELKVPYILMHMQGEPKTMQNKPVYANVVLEVMGFMVKQIAQGYFD